MEDRAPVRVATLEEYRKDPKVIAAPGHTPPKTLTMIPEWEYKGYKWGMAIDLTSCTGCGTCTIACVAENNIPVVGKDQVTAAARCTGSASITTSRATRNPTRRTTSRSLHAVRERAMRAGLPGRRHDAQLRRPERHGLQPLRRHALLLEQLPVQGAPLQLPALPGLEHAEPEPMRNPDVTVRSRGVMEKCTYCVQRINYARIDAKRAGPQDQATAKS